METDFPTPSLEAGKVVVKNEFAGINFIDTYHRKGMYPRDLPFVGGQEGGGTVAAVSDFERSWRRSLQTAWDVVHAWKGLHPLGGHRATPRRLAAALVSLALIWGWVDVAVVIALCFSCLLRPGDGVC